MPSISRVASVLWFAAGCAAGEAPGSDDSATDSDTGAVASTFCADRELPTAAFLNEGTGTSLGDVAGPFSADTTTGTLVFSEAFTGCSSFVFFVHFPGQTDDVMDSALDALVEDAPPNVVYVFLSDADKPKARRTFMEGLEARLDDTLEEVFPGAARRDAWRERFHFVTTRATEVEGSVGAFVQGMLARSDDPAERVDLGDRGMAPVPRPVVFGIDRAQTFDAGGSLSPFVGSPGDELGMAAWLPHFYDQRHALDLRMDDTTGVTVVDVMDEVTTQRVFTLPVTLPDAAAMAGFDQLEIDVTIDCRLVNPFACSEWDRIARISLCVDGEACTDRLELARWITPYWRRGRQRYALEASPMIALLRDGGEQYLRVELGPDWERATEWHAAIDLRLADTGGPRPVMAVPAFTGGGFGDAYNDRTPVAFTPPAGSTRAELVALVTGHGQTEGNNCAEWCDHRHTFSVDGADLDTIRHEGPSIGEGTGCAQQAGVMPGQWGNWAQARAYWCPGLGVTPHRLDITAQVSEGKEASLGYQASFGSGAPAGGDIALSSYVVFYSDP